MGLRNGSDLEASALSLGRRTGLRPDSAGHSEHYWQPGELPQEKPPTGDIQPLLVLMWMHWLLMFQNQLMNCHVLDKGTLWSQRHVPLI